MTKLLQINVVANSTSTGRIAEEIGNISIKSGWESYIMYGRWAKKSSSHLIKIGNKFSIIIHGMLSFLFDKHGYGSYIATQKAIKEIKKIKPDIIHIHNIHGYYLNFPLLFKYLNSTNIPIIWTLHDCWAFTGHCAYFSYIGCNKWKEKCQKCKALDTYPKSIFNIDNSEKNFLLKKSIFPKNPNLILVPVSQWLSTLLKDSFFNSNRIIQIYNGIDTTQFNIVDSKKKIKQQFAIGNKTKIILGVANVWDKRKGLEEFIKLSKLLINKNYIIILIGLSKKQIKLLPPNIIGITRTESIKELCEFYSAADVYINPTLEDNFPTTNLEAMACGTPVITYNTGGCKEAITEEVGVVIEKGDINKLISSIDKLTSINKEYFQQKCRSHIINNFNKEKQYQKYLKLYNSILNKK